MFQKELALVSIYPVCCLAVCFDAEWTRWSQIKSLSNNLLHDNTLYFLGTEQYTLSMVTAFSTTSLFGLS